MNNGNYDRIMAEFHVIINFFHNNEIDSLIWIMVFRGALTKPDRGELGFLIGMSLLLIIIYISIYIYTKELIMARSSAIIRHNWLIVLDMVFFTESKSQNRM